MSSPAEDFANWVTGIVLLLGAAGAAWKWIFAEMLRRQADRRHPALEGSIAADVIPHSDDKCIVRISCLWTNLSTSKIFLDIEKTHISLYDLADNFDIGTVSLRDPTTKYLFRSEPYEGSNYVFFEPGSRSELVATFIVPSQRSYGARAVIQMDADQMGVDNVIWFRETAFFASPKDNSPNPA